jgi:hypothetical protein
VVGAEMDAAANEVMMTAFYEAYPDFNFELFWMGVQWEFANMDWESVDILNIDWEAMCQTVEDSMMAYGPYFMTYVMPVMQEAQEAKMQAFHDAEAYYGFYWDD